MKVKRNKRNRKYLQFYATSFGIKPPYKVVVDGLYLQAALDGRVKILEQVPKLLQAPGETVIMVTKCCVHDLKQKGDFYKGATMIAATLQYARCNHEGIVEPNQCMKLLIQNGNPDHLFIGAQEVSLRHFIRDTPGVPLLFISGQVPILEPPATSDKARVNNERKERTQLTPSEQQVLKSLAPVKVVGHKRKKVKGPNPLSVKKKKVGTEAQGTGEGKKATKKKKQPAKEGTPTAEGEGKLAGTAEGAAEKGKPSGGEEEEGKKKPSAGKAVAKSSTEKGEEEEGERRKPSAREEEGGGGKSSATTEEGATETEGTAPAKKRHRVRKKKSAASASTSSTQQHEQTAPQTTTTAAAATTSTTPTTTITPTTTTQAAATTITTQAPPTRPSTTQEPSSTLQPPTKTGKKRQRKRKKQKAATNDPTEGQHSEDDSN